MARRIVICLTLVASLVLGLTVDAGARRLHPQPTKVHKASKKPAPKIKSVTPLKATVGEKLTILGKHFKPGKNKTRIFFLRKGGGVTTATPDYATKTRLVVTIPETVTPLLRGTGPAAVTRFQLRILTTRYGDPTRMDKSPLIGPASTDGGGDGHGGPGTAGEGDCDGDGIKNKAETDDDGDLIPDTTEINVTHTDPCKADTDGDKVGDGFEWQSAKDMNDTTPFNVADAALPYPGKKPWPNPLDPTDPNVDHDGDGLTLADEYKLFEFYGNDTLPLNYSDGLQISQNELASTDPIRAYMDINGDGVLSDDERDADGDFLGNWDEQYGAMTQTFWDNTYNGQHGTKKETRYIVDFPGVSMVDPDTDGDHVADGADDQDHDGLSNAFELDRPWFWEMTYVSPWHTGDGADLTPEDKLMLDSSGIVYPNPWARVQPYNPCKPVQSKTCHLHPPFGYYGDDEDYQGIDPRGLKTPPLAPWLYQGEN
jgi:hypothetical protein